MLLLTQDEESGRPSTRFASHARAAVPIDRPIHRRLFAFSFPFSGDHDNMVMVLHLIPLILLSNLHIVRHEYIYQSSMIDGA